MIPDAKINEFVQRMRKGFEDTPYPGDDNIGTTGIEAIEEDLVGIRWQDVTFQHLWDLRGGMYFLKPDAFRYYLPAFLLGILQFANRLDAFPETFIPFLIPPSPSISFDKYNIEERLFLALDTLSAEQKELVGLCLKMIAEVYPESDWSLLETPKALDQAIAYWSLYIT